MLLLSRSEVESLLDIDQLIKSLAPAMIELSKGSLSMPARGIVEIQERRGLLATMPVYLNSSKILTTKLVTVYPENECRGLPSHQAVVLVFDSATGTALALMDGTSITAARTAAGSALATRILARPEAQILALLGTGVQARSHIRAIMRVRKVREIRVWGRNAEKAAALAQDISREHGIHALGLASLRETLLGAEIICATTHSADPVVLGKYLEAGVHVNSVGLNSLGREIDEAAVLKALVVVESRDAALAPPPSGANDLTWPIQKGAMTRKHIHAELGEILSGARPGRTSPEQITLYKSVGVAVQDAVAAQLVLDAARQQNIGREIDI